VPILSGEGIMVRQIERGLAAVGAMSFLACSLACMSLNIGSTTDTSFREDGSGRQSGKLFVAPGQEAMVYYPAPYASPPNLELDDARVQKTCQIVEQRPDGFRVRNMSATPIDVGWQTRGVKATATASAPTPVQTVQPATYTGITHGTGP
jgi:hypothetical protein